jgi:ligand-binding sensor domain-containing protein
VFLLVLSLSLTVFENNIAVAQEAPPSSANLKALRFQQLNLDNNLPNSHIKAILEDKHGFMWLGTEEGLVRYDGYNFEIYKHKPDDDNSLSSDNINALWEDPNGIIWLATMGGGLNRLDPATKTFTSYKQGIDERTSIADSNVTALAGDQAGNLWFGMNNGQVDQFNTQTRIITHHAIQHCTPTPPPVQKIVVDSKAGAVWFISGILVKLELATGSFSCYPPKPSTPTPVIHFSDFVEATTGALWLAEDKALYRFDPQTSEFTSFLPQPPTTSTPPSSSNQTPPPLGNQTVWGFSVLIQANDNEGTLWLGSRNPQVPLYSFNLTTSQFIPQYKNDTANANANNVTALYQNREGLVWVGTQTAGVDLLNPHQNQFDFYSTYLAKQTPTDNTNQDKAPIHAIYQEPAPSGIIWLGAAFNLVRFNPQDNSLKQFPISTNSDSTNSQITQPPGTGINSIIPDDQGNLWFDYNNGLYRFNRNTEQMQAYGDAAFGQAQAGGRNFHQVIQDQTKNLWVLTNNTLLYFDRTTQKFGKPYQVHAPDIPSELKQAKAHVIFSDRNNNIWIGGEGFLNRLDPQTGRIQGSYTKPHVQDILPNVVIQAIYQDQTGILWLGTNGGLVRFEPKTGKAKTYSEDDGLPSNMVVAVLADQ